MTIDDVESGNSGWVRVNEEGREMEDIDSINKSQQDQVFRKNRKNNITGRVEFLETSSSTQHQADMPWISFIIFVNALWC